MLSITNNSIKHQSFVYTQLNNQKILFSNSSIQFSIGRQFKCQTVLFELKIGPYQVLPLRAKVGLGSNSNEVFCIPQSYSNTEALSTDCLVSYPGHSLRVSSNSVKMQSVYSTAVWAFITSVIKSIRADL